MLTDISFEIKIFQRHIKKLRSHIDVSTRATRQIMKDYGFYKILVQGSSAKKVGHGTRYVEDKTEIFRKQASFLQKKDIMFHTKRRSALQRAVSPSMNTDYIRT